MQDYHKERLYVYKLDYRLENCIEHSGVYPGHEAFYLRPREDGFQKPIIAHILFGLPYELTWTDAKGRSGVFRYNGAR
jgi:hypothetical protein